MTTKTEAPTPTELQCTLCQKTYPATVDYFYRCNNSAKRGGFYTQCTWCVRKRKNAYRRGNPQAAQQRIYRILPHIKTHKGGSQTQQGFAIALKNTRFVPSSLCTTHSAVELCETAIMRFEASNQNLRPAVYQQDWFVEYDSTLPQISGITPARLSAHGLIGNFQET